MLVDYRYYLKSDVKQFPSSPGPLFQNEGRGSAFDMEIIFHSHANKTHFHKKGCAPSLILKLRVFGTRKWPIGLESLVLSVNLGLMGFGISKFHFDLEQTETYKQVRNILTVFVLSKLPFFF